ncbi:MAG: hypothetical protein JOZ24_12640 [Candidatus Eremiobacteraeota bacterium]|nr:hypothetical protein [Candidatus Eremiobacteraeota bacterium]
MTATRPTTRRRTPAGAVAAGVLPVALSLIPATGTLPVTTAQCGVQCGKERWPVKTLSDGAAPNVVLTPLPSSVASLVSASTPPSPLDDSRAPLEMQAVTVDAQLVGYKEEMVDHDFHIVLRDPGTNDTMIVEIPDPQCVGVCASVAGAQIATARSSFSSTMTVQPAAKFVAFSTPVRVTVAGVPFFDFHHGQTGVAKNCVEIHPVLAIAFPDGKPVQSPKPGGEPTPLPEEDYNCVKE